MAPPRNPNALCRNAVRAVEYELARATPLGDCLLSHRPGSKSGYPCTAFEFGGPRRTVPVHRIVMLAKAGPLPEGWETRHLCGNKLCINPAHLVYDSRSENCTDTQHHGRGSFAKLTPVQVADIRRRFVPGKNQWQPGNRNELAAEYGLNPEYLRQLAAGRSWKRVEA